MTNQIMPRAGAGCGALFAVALIAASNGSADASYVAGLAAIALFLPFLAYLCSLLRQAEGEGGWLAPAALAAGLAGITIKLASVAPEIAANHLPAGAMHNALQDIANAATVISMYPLALLLAAVATIALRTRVLPRGSATAQPSPPPRWPSTPASSTRPSSRRSCSSPSGRWLPVSSFSPRPEAEPSTSRPALHRRPPSGQRLTIHCPPTDDRRRPCSHPSTGGQLARQRQREMPAQADQQRLVRQLREHSRASRARSTARPADNPSAQRARPAALPS